MKKYKVSFSALALLLFFTSAFSQKDIKGLVNAEKAFATYTASHTIRDGFLQFMDADGIVFRQGTAINAIESFQKQKSGPAILSWEPAFAAISAAGDLGITTGPYELRSGSVQDTNVARGSFSSVWRINKSGEWKNLVDLGVSYNRKNPVIQQVQEIVLLSKTSEGSFDEVLALDQKFNNAVQEKSGEVFMPQIPADSWLNMEGETPFRGVQMISNILIHIPDSVRLRAVAGNISSSHDLAYVHGTVTNGNRKENYLRVWIRRNKRWYVLLQTIKW